MLYGYFEDGEPYLQAVVAIPGFPATTVTFMVDTGSASTILSSQDAKETYRVKCRVVSTRCCIAER